MRLAALLVLLAATEVLAQTVVQLKPPPPPEPSVGFLFELKMGTLIPRVGDEKGLTSNPYETIFGNKSMLYGGGEFDFIAWHGYGAVSVGFAAGYTEKYAPALLVTNDERNGQPANEKTALILFPLRLPVAYRFDVTWSRWRIPFVPYVKVALLATPWRVTKGGATEVVNGQSGAGLKWGYGFTGGVAFVLDVLSTQMAKDLTNDTGIRHSYIFAEYNVDQLTDFGKVGLNLSARYFTFGLGFEF
ncbi:MAG TPA: MXAN_2562 family outer membrane beta-barrel protein [Myxococcaceae bacterium]|nr:MXAN_2562 family outer membrane beta-barrel protein [Myxococcaceae bacterium]